MPVCCDTKPESRSNCGSSCSKRHW